jgi:hypothetical protein
MDINTTATEVLVVISGDGDIYTIPREIVEGHKIREESKVLLAQLLYDDVSGYVHRPGQQLVDRYDIVGTEMLRAEEMRARTPRAGEIPSGTVSILPVTPLTGFFVFVHDLSRYLSIEEGNIRLC